MIVEAHEEFIQHIEAGQRRIRTLSVITLVVAIFLGASYAAQLVYPYVSGQTVVTVNLTDPSLLGLEVVALLLTFAWIFVGATDYLFATRLGRMVKQARAAERELERKLEPSSK
jgi:ABC-type transport system involved in cytochrome c biogenesis permease subunit